MSGLVVARIVFAAAVAYIGAVLRPIVAGAGPNAVFALAVALIVIALEHRLRGTGASRLLGALIGCALGVLLARAIGSGLAIGFDGSVFAERILLLSIAYLGLMIGARYGEWLEPTRFLSLFRSSGASRQYKVLDTSVVIDGRIADVCKAGFMDGTLVVPQFVLRELQLVADSSDALKRNRGRRGLDILQEMQKISDLDVMISEMDFADVPDVDSKLIELARALHGKIVTNDFNLKKIAQLRGVGVLNVNELANSLKPVVLPGEGMRVFVLKEGKEYTQGVAYLDDGTMVVVDNARRFIGKTIDIVVTSVLQTTAGKMIFGRHVESGSQPSLGTPVAVERPRPASGQV